MSRSLRIAIADDELDVREYFHSVLEELGHQVVALAKTGRQLVDQCLQSRPDLVLTDIRMPDMDGLMAAEEIYRQHPTPVILVSAHENQDLIDRAEAGHVMGYLVKPIKKSDLEPAIRLAVRRFEQFQSWQQEANDLKQALEDRKLVERAKGVVIKRLHLNEEEAFARMRKLASRGNHKLVAMAQIVLKADEMFRMLEQI